MPILIVGSQLDPHVSAVRTQLDELGTRSIVLDPWSCGKDSGATYSFGANGLRLGIQGTEASVRNSEISAVWWRLKPPMSAEILGLSRQDQEFIRREWQHFLDPLEDLLGSAYWMNPISLSLKWSRKILQLQRARELGWSIPETVITNRSEDVLTFIRGSQNIYKPLTFYIDDEKVLFTNRLGEGTVEKQFEAIAVAPGIFQRELEKTCEFRVTIVRSKVFAVRIWPQGDNAARLDWRREQLNISYDRCVLDPTIEEKLLRYQEHCGLEFGAYDLVEARNGEVYFLEVNPSGQWLLFEERTGIEVSRAIAEALSGA